MRIVSLLPSATEIAAELGLLPHLVAVSHECDYPAQVTALPRITASIIPHGLDQAEIDRQVSAALREGRPLYTVDGDLLSALAPDLILTQGLCDVCAVNEQTVATAMGNLPRSVAERARVLSLEGRSWEGVLADLRMVAEAVGIDVQDRVAALQDRWSALPGLGSGAGGPGVVMLEWPDPPFYGGHWVPQQVQAAGGRDLLGTAGADSRRVPWSAIVQADPDVLCVMACGYGLADNARFAQALYAHPQASTLRAAQNQRIWAFDANSYFSRPAPRLVRGAELLAHAFADGDDLPGEALRIRSAEG